MIRLFKILLVGLVSFASVSFAGQEFLRSSDDREVLKSIKDGSLKFTLNDDIVFRKHLGTVGNMPYYMYTDFDDKAGNLIKCKFLRSPSDTKNLPQTPIKKSTANQTWKVETPIADNDKYEFKAANQTTVTLRRGTDSLELRCFQLSKSIGPQPATLTQMMPAFEHIGLTKAGNSAAPKDGESKPVLGGK